MTHRSVLLLTFLTLVSHAAPPCSVTTLAGLPTISGSLDGRGTDAGFTEPAGISYDATTGDALVCDARNHKVRRVSASGLVTTIAGGGPSGNESGSLDGLGTAATFTVPYDVTIDAMSGEIFVTDCYSHTVRAIATDGAVTTLAGSGTRGYLDGLGTAAQFYYPKGIVIDPLTTDLLIADRNSNAIRRVTRSGAVSTIAGNGSRGSADGRVGATFFYPAGLDVDATGLMFVADEGASVVGPAFLHLGGGGAFARLIPFTPPQATTSSAPSPPMVLCARLRASQATQAPLTARGRSRVSTTPLPSRATAQVACG